MDDGVCFSPGALALLASIAAALISAMGALFWTLVRSMQDSIREAREQRDRALDGWEQTIGLGEKAVRRERRRA